MHRTDQARPHTTALSQTEDRPGTDGWTPTVEKNNHDQTDNSERTSRGNETHRRDAFFRNLRVCFQRGLDPCKLALDREDLSALRVAGRRGKRSGDAGGAGFGVLGTAGGAEGG